MGCDNSNKNTKETGIVIVNNTKTIDKKSLDAKIVLLGNTGVGKSSIAMRFTQNTFSDSHEVTIGGAYFQHQLTLPTGVSVKMHIWDTGGAERFRSMAHIYYKDAIAAIMTYDISQSKSLEGIKFWMEDLGMHADKSKMVLVLAANKCDKTPEDAYVIPLGKKYAQENNMIFKETSALSGAGIQDLFKSICEALANKHIK